MHGTNKINRAVTMQAIVPLYPAQDPPEFNKDKFIGNAS